MRSCAQTFPPIFGLFKSFEHNFAKIVAPPSNKNKYYLVHFKGRSTLKKNWCKQCRNLPINCDTTPVQNMSPSNEQRASLGAWQNYKKKHTNTIFSNLQPARIVRSPQTLHGGRARRAHHKRCKPFLDLIRSFSARSQNVDFWLLSKNNTGWLPLPITCR